MVIRQKCLLACAYLAITALCSYADPFLKTSGNDIRDNRGHGDAVSLRGVNIGGWLILEGWVCPMDSSGLPDNWSVLDTLTRRFGKETGRSLIDSYEDAWISETDLDNIAALGMNVIRLPFWYRNLQEEDGTWRNDAFKRIDWLVEKAWKRGIYTIIDFHGVPGGQREGESTGQVRNKKENGIEPDFWNNETNISRTVEIWTHIARRYRDNPAVAAYDLINEPMGAPSRDALWAVYDRLYRAIRAVDPEHMISVEACWSGIVDGKHVGWCWDILPPPGKFGWTNVLYQLHSYEWDWNNPEKQKWSIDNLVADWKAHRDWNVPCFIGEFNVMAAEESWKYAVDRFSANNMSWAVWTYKSTHGDNQDSWGVYNPLRPWPDKPNIRKDSAEDIKTKWSKWNTSAFAINPMLKRSLAVHPAAKNK